MYSHIDDTGGPAPTPEATVRGVPSAQPTQPAPTTSTSTSSSGGGGGGTEGDKLPTTGPGDVVFLLIASVICLLVGVALLGRFRRRRAATD